MSISSTPANRFFVLSVVSNIFLSLFQVDQARNQYTQHTFIVAPTTVSMFQTLLCTVRIFAISTVVVFLLLLKLKNAFLNGESLFCISEYEQPPISLEISPTQPYHRRMEPHIVFCIFTQQAGRAHLYLPSHD